MMGVTTLEITRRSKVLDGRPFGAAGGYEKIVGVLRLGVAGTHLIPTRARRGIS